MLDITSIRELKGPKLAILVVLGYCKQNVTVQYLAETTGYSPKPVSTALKQLQQMGLVSRSGHSGFMLAREEYQLPISWDMKVEPYSGVYPIETGESTDMEKRVEDLERRVRILESGSYSVESVETPCLSGETTVRGLPMSKTEAVESTVESVKSTDESVESTDSVNRLINNAPVDMVGLLDTNINQQTNNNECAGLTGESGESTDESGEIPAAAENAWKCAAAQINNDLLSGAVLTGYAAGRFTVALDNSHKIQTANRMLREKAEEILTTIMKESVSLEFIARERVVGDSSLRLNDEPAETVPSDILKLLPVPAFETYRNQIRNTEICNEYLLDPVGIEFTEMDMRSLISHGPDPEVLRFVLRKATCLENAFRWIEMDLITVKRKVLRKYGILNGTAAKISHDENATLDMIDEICSELCPEKTGLAVDRILKMAAESVPEM